MQVWSFQVLQQLGQGFIPSDTILSHLRLLVASPELQIQLIPSRYLTHGCPDIGGIEIKITLLPGYPALRIDMPHPKDGGFTLSGLSLLTGSIQQRRFSAFADHHFLPAASSLEYAHWDNPGH